MHAEPTVLLTMRSDQLSSHAGQIAFPGGAIDMADASPVHAALREAREEVGLAPQLVEVLGELPVCFTSTGFRVTPVVGLVDVAADWQPNPGEVSGVFQVPLHYLMTPSNHRWHRAVLAGAAREWLSMPYSDQGLERYIWGATAQMLRSLYDVLVNTDAPQP
jgi:8-oxo-dGTP pyrophosphatase MutT (NUDIX family)